MTTQNQVTNSAIEAIRRVIHEGQREMLTGKRVGSQIVMSGAPTGKTWVRSNDASREATAVYGVITMPNVSVVVGPDLHGHDRILYVPESSNVPTFGDKVALLSMPPVQGDLVGLDVTGRNFRPGRVRPYADSGSMLVYVEPFAHHEGRYAGGTIDLTSDIPATAGTCAWVAVALDPATDTLYSYAGTDSYDAPANLDEADAHAITVPNGYIPLAAVVLEEGMTEITAATRIVDLRPHFYTRGGVVRDLDDLANVDTTGKADGDALVWDDGAGEWVTDAVAGAIDVTDGTTTVSPATELLFDATKFDVTDNGGGQAEVTLAPGAVIASGSKTRITETILYENTLGSDGAWDVDNSDLNTGVGELDDYDELVIELRGLRGTVNAVNDRVLLLFGTGGGGLDTTATNYYVSELYAGKSVSSEVGGSSSDEAWAGFIPALTAPANTVGNWTIRVPNPGSGSHKNALSHGVLRTSATVQYYLAYGLTWENTGAIDQIAIRTDNHATDLIAAGASIRIIGRREEAIGGLDTSTANVSNPPTDAELDSALGTPASVGAGYQCLLDDNGADTNVYLVISNGTSWWYTALTKAT